MVAWLLVISTLILCDGDEMVFIENPGLASMLNPTVWRLRARANSIIQDIWDNYLKSNDTK